MKYAFTVPGKPKAKERPRFSGKTGKVYTPKNTKNYEELVKWCFLRENPRAVPLTGSVKMSVVAYFSPPKQITKKRKREIEEGLLMPTAKPDCDNILKAVSDALNGVAYKDDSQICGAYVEKRYELFGEARVCVEVKDAEV